MKGTGMTEKSAPPAANAAGCYMQEQAIRDRLVELAKDQVMNSPFEKGPDGTTQRVPVNLALGLGCVALMLEHGLLGDEERRRLAARINVLLRAHRLMALPLQVSDV